MSSTVDHCSSVMSTSGHRAAEPGVVHRHVDAAEARDRAVVERADLRLVAHVAGQRVHPLGAVRARLGRQLLGRLGQAPFVGVGDHDRRALFAGSAGPWPTRCPVPAAAVTRTTLSVQQPVARPGAAAGAAGRRTQSRLVLTPPLSAPAGGRAPAHR